MHLLLVTKRDVSHGFLSRMESVRSIYKDAMVLQWLKVL